MQKQEEIDLKNPLNAHHDLERASARHSLRSDDSALNEMLANRSNPTKSGGIFLYTSLWMATSTRPELLVVWLSCGLAVKGHLLRRRSCCFCYSLVLTTVELVSLLDSYTKGLLMQQKVTRGTSYMDDHCESPNYKILIA